jgi:hypothetical protein
MALIYWHLNHSTGQEELNRATEKHEELKPSCTALLRGNNTRAARVVLDRPARSWWGKALGAQTGLDLCCRKSQKRARTRANRRARKILAAAEPRRTGNGDGQIELGLVRPEVSTRDWCCQTRAKFHGGRWGQKSLAWRMKISKQKETWADPENRRKHTGAGQENKIGLH